MNAVDAAIAAVRRGWHVFPAGGQRNPKAPRDGWRWAEWSTVDPAKVRLWLAGTDVYGINCGKSGLVVIDLDTAKPGSVLGGWWAGQAGITDGTDVLAALCELAGQPWPHTYTVRTPSGGQHLYFRDKPGWRITVSVGNAGGIAPMVDVRGAGGYVIGAGSVTSAGRYEVLNDVIAEPLPAWLADGCEKATSTPPARPAPAVPHYGRHDNYARSALDAEAGLVASAPEGSRNHQLNKSAYAVARFVIGGQLTEQTFTAVLSDAARRAGLSDAETARTIRSALTARRARG